MLKRIVSGLYVPGNQERMLLKCITAKADLLVPDLEDSVPMQEKPKARELIKLHIPKIRAAMGEQMTLVVRTNGLESGLFQTDVNEILNADTVKQIDGFCVTKVDTVEMAREVCTFLASKEKIFNLPENSLKVVPQIESTRGLLDVKEILAAGKGRFTAAAFGADDFTADFEIHRSDSDSELDFARKYFALACHARGVVSIDTPYVKFKDTEGLKRELVYLKSIGMKAKFAIHPSQIDVINDAFRPSAEVVARYQRMVEQFEHAQKHLGKAAIDFEGEMVDIAAYKRALAMIR